jgi:phage-related protein
MDRFEPQGLYGISCKSAGHLWVRVVLGANRATSTDCDSAVYVLHCFKKKSKQGVKTPQSDIELVKRRLRDAEADYATKVKQETAS